MPRGGRRPGAGAPKGNVNAFKDGKTSRQYRRMLEIVQQDPEMIRLLREVALGNEKRAARRRRYALSVLKQVLERLEQQANDRAYEAWERSQPGPFYTHPGD
jgi:hypothetical protein